MPRVKTGTTRKRKHNKILKAAKGYRMSYSTLVKRAKEALLHAGDYAYRGRKERKRQLRKLWIKRINAGLSNVDKGPKYSRFISLLKKNNIKINRKMLSHLALTEPKAFESIVKNLK
jgi:large subunit ribosomal protein L20